MIKLRLRDVTLIAATTQNVQLTEAALHVSSQYIVFDEILFFTPDQHRDGNYKHIRIEPWQTKENASIWGIRELGKHIKTKHVLCVQWDGFVLHPDMWQPRFLNYDYIGATWPWLPEGQNVGNGGFCLKSKRLLDMQAELSFDTTEPLADDVFICRTMRKELEQKGIKFAPSEVADQFSYERAAPKVDTFGFHGLFNFWRELDDEYMLSIIPMMADYVIKGQEYAELIAAYSALGKFNVVEALTKRWR